MDSIDRLTDNLAIALGSKKPRQVSSRIDSLSWIDRPLDVVKHHLGSSIQQFKPDLIIVFERKGRALLRALLDANTPRRFEWAWEKVLSSAMVESRSLDFFADKSVLIFDDTLRTGANVSRLIEDLRSRSNPPKQISVSMIGAHRDGNEAIRRIECSGIPVNTYFKNLDTGDFHALRKTLVEAVRAQGALLLDTEHAELRFETSATFREVVDALGRNADTVVFESGRQTKNITVYYGTMNEAGEKGSTPPPHQFSKTDFPGCGFTNIVKKARVIRCSETEYTIIPFCLPSVPADSFQWQEPSWQLKVFGNIQPHTKEERFYQVGLLASLEVLGWTVKNLCATIGDKISFRYPLASRSESNPAYDYFHLLPIYPDLNMSQLVARVIQCASDNKKDGALIATNRQIASRRRSTWNQNNYELSKMEQDARRLVQCIAHEISKRQVRDSVLTNLLSSNEDFDDVTDLSRRPNFGLRAREVFNLGQMLNLGEPEVSALFDLLIDNATLVTKIESQRLDNDFKCVRTFRPDGEVMSGLIREYTWQYGLPYEAFHR